MKYKVEFEIEGEWLGSDCNLNVEELKEFIMNTFDVREAGSYFNRDIDTNVSKLKVKKVKEVK